MYIILNDHRTPRLMCSIALLTLTTCQPATDVDMEGELKKWHRVELVFDGPNTSELAEDNPYLNYRLDVTFSHGNTTYHYNLVALWQSVQSFL